MKKITMSFGASLEYNEQPKLACRKNLAKTIH